MDLRPLGMGELLDAAINLCRRHARTFVLIVLVVVVPIEVLKSLVVVSSAPESLHFGSSDSTHADAGVYAGQLVSVLLSVVSFLLATAACFTCVQDAYLGQEPDWRRSLRTAVRRAPALLWLIVVAVLGLLLAFVVLVLPGVWLAVAWSVAVPVLLFEDRRGAGALRRSFRLVRHRWFSTFGVVFIGFLLAAIVGGIVQAALLLVPVAVFDDNTAVNAVTVAVARTLGSLLTTPFQAAIVSLLYFDLRVRKEGLDLELRARRIGGDDAALAPG